MRARDMSALQKLINHTNALNAIIAHLQHVFNKDGADGLKRMMRAADDRSHMQGHSRMGLDSVDFSFCDANAKKILKLFKKGMATPQAREAFEDIAEVFNSDLRFQQLMVHYQTQQPEDAEKMRNFLLSEAACCLLETCMTVVNKKLFAQWRQLQGDRNASEQSVTISEEQAKLKDELEDSVLLLGNVRAAVADYRHPDTMQAVNRVSLMSKKIDLSNMNEDDQEFLAALLHAYPKLVFFDENNPDTGKPMKYLVPDPHKSGVSRYVKLSQSLVRYRRKKSPEDRFAVCASTPLGDGSYGVVYESMATISIKPGQKGKLDRAVYKKKKVEKARVVKQFNQNRDTHIYDAENIKREGEILQKVVLLHAKQESSSEQQGRSALVMRKFKGKELIDHLIADWGADDDVINPSTFTVDQRIALTIMVGKAIIEQVHAIDVIHRDIKGDNIMVELDKNNNALSAVVIDYGLAKHKGEITPEHVGTSGTIDYRAPELLKLQNPTSDEKSDAYSFGQLLKEIIWYNVVHGKRYEGLSKSQRMSINDVLKRSTSKDPDQRASIQDIVDIFISVARQRDDKRDYSY